MRYFLKLSYDGTNYHGWQVQTNAISVQEVLESSLSILLSKQIQVLGSGRTDTGVHASVQFAHFDTNVEISDYQQFIYKLNSLLPNDIAIHKLFLVNDFAHARFDAIERSYVYNISKIKNPFNYNFSWNLRMKLDIKKMNETAKLLLNHQDFTSFSKLHTNTLNNNCVIKRAYFIENEDDIQFHITSNRFLRGMVRAIVGTLVDVGLNKITLQEFDDIILSKNRENSSANAPARGLFLSNVVYPENIFISKAI